jgi:hypothetical protein
MKSAMCQLVAGHPGGAGRGTLLTQTRGLMYQAFDENSEQRRIWLAKNF